MDIKEKFRKCGIIPVVVLDKKEDALPLAASLLEGEIDVAEITFRTEAAEESIRLITENVPEMLVGAGTVLTLEQLEKAFNAGAKFIVSPGFDAKIVKRAKELNLAVFPGGITPTEIISILNEGLEIVKFFPAGNYGGIKTMKSLSAAFSNIEFMPTGGVNKDNLNEFLEFDKIIAVGGSWICDKNIINAANWKEITRLCKEAREIYKAVRG